jgi:uncharacterized membrane-anchored protein
MDRDQLKSSAQAYAQQSLEYLRARTKEFSTKVQDAGLTLQDYIHASVVLFIAAYSLGAIGFILRLRAIEGLGFETSVISATAFVFLGLLAEIRRRRDDTQ